MSKKDFISGPTSSSVSEQTRRDRYVTSQNNPMISGKLSQFVQKGAGVSDTLYQLTITHPPFFGNDIRVREAVRHDRGSGPNIRIPWLNWILGPVQSQGFHIFPNGRAETSGYQNFNNAFNFGNTINFDGETYNLGDIYDYKFNHRREDPDEYLQFYYKNN